jgi:ubiquinone biosynthesis protein UbiJ
LTVFEPGLRAALNHLLRDAEWARRRLAEHAGRRARIEVGPFALRVAVSPEGTLVDDPVPDEPDLLIEIPPGAVLRSVEDSDAVMRSARMRGNIDFAEALGFVLRHLRWDVEEDLSRIAGDVVAHRLVAAGEDLRRALADGGRRFAGAASEYVIHEARVVVPAADIACFSSAVDDLRDAAERFDARLRRLEQSLLGQVPRMT